MARVTVEVPEEADVQDSIETVSDKSPVEPQPEPAVTPETNETSSEVITPASHKPLKINPKKLAIIGVLALIIILVTMLVNTNQERNQLKQAQEKSLNSQTQTEDEAKKLKDEVGQFLELPSDELPTVATVADASKVKTQSFFANSQNGDKVLIFSQAGKAVLYRPSTKKIIELAPINLNNPETTTPSSDSTTTR